MPYGLLEQIEARPIIGTLLEEWRLRYGYVLLAYADRLESEPYFPVAVVCVALHPDANSALFVRTDWESQVDEKHRDYLRCSFEDWLKVLENNRGVMPPSLLELSVGPLRSVRNGGCDEQELVKHVEAFLQAAYQRFEY